MFIKLNKSIVAQGSHVSDRHIKAYFALVVVIAVVFQILAIPKPHVFILIQVKRPAKFCKNDFFRVPE